MALLPSLLHTRVQTKVLRLAGFINLYLPHFLALEPQIEIFEIDTMQILLYYHGGQLAGSKRGETRRANPSAVVKEARYGLVWYLVT